MSNNPAYFLKAPLCSRSSTKQLVRERLHTGVSQRSEHLSRILSAYLVESGSGCLQTMRIRQDSISRLPPHIQRPYKTNGILILQYGGCSRRGAFGYGIDAGPRFQKSPDMHAFTAAEALPRRAPARSLQRRLRRP